MRLIELFLLLLSAYCVNPLLQSPQTLPLDLPPPGTALTSEQLAELKTYADIAAGKTTIRLQIIASENSSLGYDYQTIRPGLEIAIEKAYRLYNILYDTSPPQGTKIKSPTMYKATCGMAPSAEPVGKSSDLISALKNFAVGVVFLAPACTMDFVACMNLYPKNPAGPFVTGGGHYTSNAPPCGIRIAYSGLDVWQPVLSIFDKFSWTDFCVIFYRAGADEDKLNSFEKLRKGTRRSDVIYI